MPTHPGPHRTARRELVLRLLRTASHDTGVAEIAKRLAVHPNTVRFHLDALEAEGLVERAAPIAEGRGRPTLKYRAVPHVDPGPSRIDLLADILFESLGDGRRAITRASRAGNSWGRRHAERAPADGSSTHGLVAYLDEIGFAPHRSDPQTIELHSCPFGAAVQNRGEVVCALHAGLVNGALTGWHAPEATLVPFVRPGVCQVRLERTGAAA